MRRVVTPLVVMITLSLATALALAHVSPSVDDNNRYVKLTPQADRLRLAYTVFFGEVPGAALRPTLDKNRDGTISDAEAQTYGDRIAADVLASLDLAIDGKQQRLRWQQIMVGMGSPTVNAGSFSVDMITYACLPNATAGRRHELLLKDRYRVPKPGETEVRVEDSIGLTVESARIGTSDALANDFKFVGPGGPFSDDGLKVVFVASDKAPRSGECATLEAPSEDRVPWLAIGIAAAGALLVIAVLVRKLTKRPAK
jgi:hypothetical protein